MWVYILASKPRGTLYIGVTNDLIRRIWEHKTEIVKGFTAEYGVKDLVYFEFHAEKRAALQRERNLKHWLRAWKIALIEKENSAWRDLYDEICK